MTISIDRARRAETARARPRKGDTGILRDWRERLLAELCAGREGARLRRRLRAYATRAVSEECRQNYLPGGQEFLDLGSYPARVVGALCQLATHRCEAPEQVARYEERIRFARARVDELWPPNDGRVRLDRIVIALQILDEHLRCAEAFIDLATRDTELRRIA
jgi:hypothetical protein